MDKKNLILILIIVVFISIVVCCVVYFKIKEDNITDIEYINEAGVEYDSSQLDNFEFQLTNIPQEFENENIDIEALTMKVKEYLYKKGLITATIGEIINYENNNENIELIIELNDNKNSQIKITINKN